MAAAAKTTSSSSSASPGRSWRTAFLTLRDEIQTLTPPASSSSVLHLLDHHLFSQSDTLISATRHLPPHEVTADVMLLMELARNVSFDESTATLDDQLIQSFIRLLRFIHIVCSRVSFTINSKSWTLCLDCFTRMVDTFLGKAKANASFPGHAGVVGATKQSLETLRLLVGEYQKTILLSEYKQLLYMLHGVITFFQSNSSYSNYSTCHPSVWEVQRIAFTMIGELYSRAGTSLTVDIWQSTIEVIRKVMDALASKGLPAEDSVLTAFYYSLLHCLHLVLLDPKGSLSTHVAGFVAALKLFLNYGISSRNRFLFPEASQRKEIHSTWKKLNLAESSKSNSAPYRPPHLRKKEPKNLWLNNKEYFSSSEPESSAAYQTSSDSDYSSDGDGSGQDVSNAHYDRSRLAAIVCIQDLCRADPKLFTSQWTMLLPCYDVLQPRKHEATLMSCLLFDPYLKARLMSASTIATMLDGTASVFLQVAEFKDSAKRGSFTALSSSLGQILMQLHTGTLYLVKHERRRSLLASLFKVLVPLISCTPYPRMPSDLLPKVISSIQGRIEDGFFLQSDHTSLLAAAIDCLTVVLSVSPPSVEVKHMLSEEAAAGFPEEQKQNKPGVLSTLFRCSDPATSPSINFEALQALRAVAHNYPTTVFPCWKQVSSTVYGFLSSTPDVPTRLWKNNAGHSGGASWETVITAAIKVLDECLRAVSGFKGTEDLSDDKFLLGPFTSDCAKTKTISSAPFHGSEDPAASEEEVEICSLGSEQWSEAIFKHIPCILKHPSGMVRTAAITCFAGLTSPVFFSLRKDDQNFILSCSLNAAAGDDVPSVRSAACRAIGVHSCFPLRSVEIVDKLVSAVVSNTSDSLISVRITASWALANISDSLRHSVHAPTFENDSKASFQLIELLIDNALRLTNDNDKIKANAVRALGNLSKFIQFPSNFDASNDEVSCMLVPITTVKSKVENIGENSKSFRSTTSKASVWLGKMVQAFISCVTTGNVKVQWNVCHALSNLFFNRTLKLQDMDWAPSVFSILLLLLRDSANFKIRIQAAAALAVPSRVDDYGRSFYDVLHGMVHVLENLSSDQISTPSNFKYRVALEKQMTSTLLHVLVLASGTNHRPVQDFLAKKALFLEEWLKGICLYLEERTIQLECRGKTYVNEKEVVARALQSLIEVFEDSNHTVIVPRFHKLLSGITR